MSQAVLLEKLTKFLKVTDSSPRQTQTESLRKTLELLPGCCFSLALCHAVMDVTDKPDWWENVLILLHNWDITQQAGESEQIYYERLNQSLQQEIYLPQSRDKKTN